MAEPIAGEQPRRRSRSRLGATVRALVRTRITTGLIVVLPIYLTLVLLKWVFGVMRDASQWVVFALLEAPWFQKNVWRLELPEGEKFELGVVLERYPYLDWGIAVVSVLLTVLLLYAIGLFAANLVGRRVIETFDRTIERVPFVKTVYRAVKQMLAALTSEQSQSFQRVALIPFPQDKMRCVGFITNTFTDSVTGEELCSVFIPTTPNPTTGYLQILRREDITEIDCTVEDGFRLIMSAGILKPDFLTVLPNKALPDDLHPPSVSRAAPTGPESEPRLPPAGKAD